MLKNYDRVRLVTNDYENEGVSDGAVGYIVETYDDGVYEVEFSDPEGTTLALIALRESELEFAELSKTASDKENMVMLDPDVKKYFPDSESVNHALRCLIPLLYKNSGSEVRYGERKGRFIS